MKLGGKSCRWIETLQIHWIRELQILMLQDWQSTDWILLPIKLDNASIDSSLNLWINCLISVTPAPQPDPPCCAVCWGRLNRPWRWRRWCRGLRLRHWQHGLSFASAPWLRLGSRCFRLWRWQSRAPSLRRFWHAPQLLLKTRPRARCPVIHPWLRCRQWWK